MLKRNREPAELGYVAQSSPVKGNLETCHSISFSVGTFMSAIINHTVNTRLLR